MLDNNLTQTITNTKGIILKLDAPNIFKLQAIIRKKYLIWNLLVFFNIICCCSQIVNEGIFYISDSTSVYFESNYTNKSTGTHENEGNLYFDKNFINNGKIISRSGGNYFKCTIDPEINISDISKKNDKEIDDTTAIKLLKLFSLQNNQLKYLGHKSRKIQINMSLFKGEDSEYSTYYISKNSSTILTKTNTLIRVNNTSDKSNHTISGTVELSPNDYIEIWRQGNNDSITVPINVCKINIELN